MLSVRYALAHPPRELPLHVRHVKFQAPMICDCVCCNFGAPTWLPSQVYTRHGPHEETLRPSSAIKPPARLPAAVSPPWQPWAQRGPQHVSQINPELHVLRTAWYAKSSNSSSNGRLRSLHSSNALPAHVRRVPVSLSRSSFARTPVVTSLPPR